MTDLADVVEGTVLYEPRHYQAEALDRIAEAEARGVRRQLGVAATGTGKTIIFSMLAERRGGRALVLAHREELVAQAAEKIRQIWPGVTVGIVKAGENQTRAHVVVASVQTLARKARLDQLCAAWGDEQVLTMPVPPFDLVVADEAHHCAADTYRVILDRLRAGDPGCMCGNDHERAATPEEVDAGCELGVAYDPCPMTAPGPLLLGVTATPDRGDGKGLDDLFDEIVWSYDILWGIRSGYLSDIRGLRVTLDRLDMSNVKVRRGDYEAGAAGRAMEDADAPALIVAAWLEHALGRRTLVFTPTVDLARSCRDEFAAAGVRAGFVHGGTPLDERRAILAAYSAGDIDVLTNCAVLTEGYDEPRTDCIVMARPTKSRALYTQCVGRGTRRHPDKTDCLVLDVVGATELHSLVTVPSLFGLGDGYAREMGDGSGLLTDTVGRHEQEQVRQGILRAEEVELFAAMRSGGMAWVATHVQGTAPRYVLDLGAEQGKLVMVQVRADVEEGGEGWAIQHQHQIHGQRTLMRNGSLEMCQGIGEDYARRHGEARMFDPNAGWRRRPPSPRQLAAAGKWRLPNAGDYATAGELSEAMTAHIERKRKAKR